MNRTIANYLITYLKKQPGHEDAFARYDYREVGDLWIEGDSLFVAPYVATDNNGMLLWDKDKDEAVFPRAWSPTMVCFGQPLDGSIPFVEAVLIVVPDGLVPPEEWSYESHDGFRLYGCPYFIGVASMSQGLASDLLTEAGNRLIYLHEDDEIRRQTQEVLEQLRPFLLSDHLLNEGWCTLSNGENATIASLVVNACTDMGGRYISIHDHAGRLLAVIAHLTEDEGMEE